MRYPQMLAELKPLLDDIEEQNEKDHRFIESLLIRHEEGTLTLSNKQLVWLRDCYDRYVSENDG